MAIVEELRIGSRVRLRSASHVLTLRSMTGEVLRKDEWADYYVIRLDRPALHHRADGSTEDLEEICESADNLDVLPC